MKSGDYAEGCKLVQTDNISAYCALMNAVKHGPHV